MLKIEPIQRSNRICTSTSIRKMTTMRVRLTSNVSNDDVKVFLDILFYYKRKKLDDDQFHRHLNEWIRKLLTICICVGNDFDLQLFILKHLFNLPNSQINNYVDYIQIPYFNSNCSSTTNCSIRQCDDDKMSFTGLINNYLDFYLKLFGLFSINLNKSRQMFLFELYNRQLSLTEPSSSTPNVTPTTHLSITVKSMAIC